MGLRNCRVVQFRTSIVLPNWQRKNSLSSFLGGYYTWPFLPLMVARRRLRPLDLASKFHRSLHFTPEPSVIILFLPPSSKLVKGEHHHNHLVLSPKFNSSLLVEWRHVQPQKTSPWLSTSNWTYPLDWESTMEVQWWITFFARNFYTFWKQSNSLE